MHKKIMKLSEFLEEDISPLVLGAFFSRYVFKNDNKYIITTTSYKNLYKEEKWISLFEKSKKQYLQSLNEFSMPHNFWGARDMFKENIDFPAGLFFFILENDLNVTEESFFNKIYFKVFNSDWFFEKGLTEKKKQFISGYMELRGSIDTQRRLVAQDYFYNSAFEMKKARLFVDYLNVPTNVVNLNFRELQKQFYENVSRRNTQFRINLFWYLENIGLINTYKAEKARESYDLDKATIKDGRIYYECDISQTAGNSNAFDEKLLFYSENIFNKNITDEEIQALRMEIGFEEREDVSYRSAALVEIIRLNTPDECVCCKGIYDISDRSFIRKKDGRWYTEIHHVISLGNNKQLDDEDNMVKLCPTCHKALKKGISSKDYQEGLIEKIYDNAPNVLDFAKHFFDTDNFKNIVELTQQNLR